MDDYLRPLDPVILESQIGLAFAPMTPFVPPVGGSPSRYPVGRKTFTSENRYLEIRIAPYEPGSVQLQIGLLEGSSCLFLCSLRRIYSISYDPNTGIMTILEHARDGLTVQVRVYPQGWIDIQYR